MDEEQNGDGSSNDELFSKDLYKSTQSDIKPVMD